MKTPTLSLIRSKLIVKLRSFLREIYKLRLGRMPELRALLDSFKSSESAAVDPADAIAIYEAVMKRKPACILELGAGTSSAVISLAISQLQKTDAAYSPRFIAVEENEKWLSYHESKFPPDLRAHAELIHRPSAGKELRGVRVAHYVDVPRLPYDFIHIDGPDHLSHGAKVCSDVIDLAPVLAPSCLVIFDARQSTVWFTAKHLVTVPRRNPFSLNWELTVTGVK